MVTIKNDIESSGPFVPTSTHPIKDVNLKRHEAKPSRRRSYRCVTIVAVVVLVFMGLGVGSVLYFGKALNRVPTQAKDGMPSTTTTSTTTTTPVPVEPSSSAPTFVDPYDVNGQAETAIGSTYDDEFDIDGPVEVDSTMSNCTSTTTGTVTTPRCRLFSDEGSGSGEYDDEDGYDKDPFALF